MALSQKVSKKEKTTVSTEIKKIRSTSPRKTCKQCPQEKLLQDLEDMYQAAFEAKNFAVALRILELRGKQQGLFSDKKEPLKSLQHMSDQELQSLLNN